MTPGAHLQDIGAASLWTAMETAAELSQLGIYIARVDVNPPAIVYANPHAELMCGRAMVGIPPWTILRQADWPTVQAAVARPPGAPPLSFAVTIEQPSGKQVPVELTATRIVTPGGTYVFGYARDVSAERDALEALRRSEARFQFLIENAPDGVVIVTEGRVAFVNAKAAELFGVGNPTDALGRSLGSFLPRDEAERAASRIADVLRGAELPSAEYHPLADPARVIEIKSIRCEWAGEPAVLGFARDVTARKAIERRLIEADRLSAMGTLAASVAHEINNPLSYALLGVQQIELAIGGMPADVAGAIRERLRDVEHGITRVAAITKGLRTFARSDGEAIGPVDLAAVVERALRLVDGELRHVAEVTRQFADVPPVSGNAARLEQIIVNLLLNAKQALRPDGPREIAVSIAPRGSAYVALAVRDGGHGIPAEIASRIFDPFFTTRPIGEGMGLGLAVSRTLVEGMGGQIEVASTPGAGTVMTVVLRVHAGRPAADASRVAARRGPQKRILIVDDEPLVRDALTRYLQRDHEVTAADSADAALGALRAGTYDVILCDVMMPRVDGAELYRRITAEWPGLERRVIFISAGAVTPALAAFLRATPNPCLTKPFQLDAIDEAIRTCGG